MQIPITRRGGGTQLNFPIIVSTTEPDNPEENTIWVKQSFGLSEWKMAPNNPYATYKDVDLLSGKELLPGFYASDGNLSSQNSTKLEVYTNPINAHEINEFAFEYTLSSTNEMWMAVCEYDSEDNFLRRILLVSSVSGTVKTGTYRKTSDDVWFIRLCWRTFGDDACSVAFKELDAAYTKDSTPNHAIWLRTSLHTGIPVNTCENAEPFRIVGAKYKGFSLLDGSDYTWYDVDASIYQSGAWVPLKATDIFLYAAGDTCFEQSGGWNSCVGLNGALMRRDDSLQFMYTGTSGRYASAYTGNPIDLTEHTKLIAVVSGLTTASRFLLGVGKAQYTGTSDSDYIDDGYAAAYAIHNTEAADKTEVVLDISKLSGMYFVQMIAASTNVTVHEVRLST